MLEYQIEMLYALLSEYHDNDIFRLLTEMPEGADMDETLLHHAWSLDRASENKSFSYNRKAHEEWVYENMDFLIF